MHTIWPQVATGQWLVALVASRGLNGAIHTLVVTTALAAGSDGGAAVGVGETIGCGIGGSVFCGGGVAGAGGTGARGPEGEATGPRRQHVCSGKSLAS